MKVYSFPDHIEPPKLDFTNFDMNAYQAKEDACNAELKAWLIAQGWNGSNTGEIYRIPHADGHAQYMVAEGPRQFGLIHLPYMDAWDSPWASRATKNQVLQEIERSKRVAALFAAKAG